MCSLSDFYFTEKTEIICGQQVPSICENFNADCPSVVDRYFTRFYYRKPNTIDEDHLILFHSNRICLIGLANSHIAIKKGIKSINYNIGNVDRSQNQCSGKGKKGGMNLQPPSALAIIICNDDSEYKVLSCVTSKLIEVNNRLLTETKLLGTDGDGYIAIVLPKAENCEKIKNELLTQEQYDKLVESQNENKNLV